MAKPLVTRIFVVTLLICVAGVGLMVRCNPILFVDFLSGALAPTETPSLEEILAMQALASRLGVRADWSTIFDYVSYEYIPLRLSREEIHARLLEVGSFQIGDVRSHTDDAGRPVLDEQITFDNPHIGRGLGKRVFTYDMNGRLIESHVILVPSGEVARLLPTPPGSWP